jgi:hypothetical protein
MLPDWYFCCCISASPSKTSAFLSILEILDNRKSDNQLLYLAYDELLRTEVWMQVYAMPKVLRSLQREDLPDGIGRIIRSYFNDLIEIVPDVSEKLQSVIEQLISGAASHRLMEELKACARAVLELPSDRRLSPIPYLDLKDFLAETVLLSVIADRMAQDRDFAENLAGTLKKDEGSPVGMLLQNALDYKNGRLAFRLAVRIAHLTSVRHKKDELLSRIWMHRYCIADIEPDLAQATAEVIFHNVNSDTAEHKADMARRIMEETWTLVELRKLLQISLNRRSKSSDPLNRIGFEPLQNNLNYSLPIIYWQASLWELAVQIDPVTASLELASHWSPPGDDPPEMLEICGPFNKEEASYWKEQLKTLLNMRTLRTTNLRVMGEKNLSMPSDCRWLFLSPWFRLDLKSLKSGQWKRPRYPAARNAVSVIRLIMSLYLSVKLLKQTTVNNSDSDNRFLSLIAHASDVLETTYDFWLRNYEKIEDSSNSSGSPKSSESEEEESREFLSLPLPITGLAIFARDQIGQAGRGYVESISPNSFLELLYRQEPEDTADDSSQTRSVDEDEFYRTILPEVLLSWIKDAYTGAIGSSGPTLWLELIPEIYRFFRQGRHNQMNRVKAALVFRFLCPEHKHKIDLREFDWRNNQKQWRVQYRKMLLTQALPAEEWVQPDWDETSINSHKRLGNRLVRSIERLASLKRVGDLPGDLVEAWRKDWIDCLNSVSKTEELDRFIRLRLLELLDDSLLADSQDGGQELIALVLLEYGSYYELKKMLDKIYAVDGQDRLEPVSAMRQRVRSTLLYAMYKDIALNSEDRENRPNVRDPHITKIPLYRMEIIQQTLCRIAYYSKNSKDPFLSNDLYRTLVQLDSQMLHQLYNRDLRIIWAEVEDTGNSKRILLPPEAADIENWMIRAAVYDPNMLKVTLFADDLDTRGVLNFLERPREEVQAFQNKRIKETTYVVAVLVSIEERREGGYRYRFNCGFGYYLTQSRHSKTDFEPNSYVALPIQYAEPMNQKEQKEEFVIVEGEGKKIRKLKRRLIAGDIDRVLINEYWDEDLQRRQIEVKHNGVSVTGEINMDLWDADTSRSFCNFEPTKHPVFARLGDDGRPVPIDNGLTHLLLKGFKYENAAVAVLTLVDHNLNTPLGERAWRFAAEPGENYFLRRSDFMPDDADELEEEIQRLEKPQGLLIVVTAVAQDSNVRLRLWRQKVNDPRSRKFFLGLRTPFDHRNIEWRDLFKEPVQVAERRGMDWYVNLEPGIAPGYPRRVTVEWDSHSFRLRSPKAEFIVSRWDFKSATVYGEFLRLNRITLKDEDWNSFLKRWINIEQPDHKGDHIRLERPFKKISSQGLVHCLTSEGIRVQADAESLTMRPFESQNFPDTRLNMMAEVLWAKVKPLDLPTKPLLDPLKIPEAAIENNCCRGIFIEVPTPSDRSDKAGSLCKVLWQAGEQAIIGELIIDNLLEVGPIYPGNRIVGRLSSSEWQFSIQSLLVRVRGLWSVTEWHQEQKDLCYLGMVHYRDTYRHIAELRPGELVLLPPTTEKSPHLAIGDGLSFKGGLKADLKTRNVAEGRSWKEGRDGWIEHRRALLPINDKVLIGNCRADSPNQNISISHVRLFLYRNSRNNSLFSLNRFFEFHWPREAKLKGRELIENDTQYWRQKLDEYLKSPRDLLVELKGSAVYLRDLRVPAVNNPTKWVQVVPLAKGEGPFVDNHYSEIATVRLFEDTQNQILASFRRVPPHSPDRFRTHLAANFNQFFDLREAKLYYVGPEASDPITGVEYKETHHRFEWAYGKTLLVPESRLRFEGNPFNQAELILFYGDIITGITFLPADGVEEQDPSAEATTSGAAQCIIAINKVHLQFSEATALYSQRRKHQVVHILHLTLRSREEIEIDYVESFDENRSVEICSFDRSRAALTKESRQRLLDRYKDKIVEPGQIQFTIFGRLDEKCFQDTLGRSVLFEHVRLSYKESLKGSRLFDNELIFLQTKNITPLENDIALEVDASNLLDKEDIGEDIGRSIRILRRHFSVREDLLKRIYEEKEAEHIINRRLLVRLIKMERGGVMASLMRNIPRRTTRALAGRIAVNKGPLLAAVVRTESGGVEIELSPGTFVKIPDREIEERPERLSMGAIVKVERTPAEKFRIIQAAFGHARYVTVETRPAVMLPKNDMLNEDLWNDCNVAEDDYWLDNRGFTIGGLPNIVAVPGSYDKDNAIWGAPRAQDFIRLMETRHPKIVRLGRDNNRFRIGPPAYHFPAGCLEISEKGFDVKYVLLRDPGDRKYRDLDWPVLTFGDESALEVIRRSRREKWKYHDSKTGTWADNNRIDFETLDNYNLSDVFKGPVFFETGAGNLRLRYSEKNFLRFGFPVDELIRSLSARRGEKSAIYPVAGISTEGGLWIELAPGRIVELPSQLLVWQARVNEISLARLNWTSFALGDQIEIGIASNNPLNIERIALKSWRPGPRKAFGPQRCFLPVLSCQERSGAVTLGGGEFTLTLPIARPDSSLRTVALYPDNRILKAEELHPEPGDVVLVCLDENGRPIVSGFPKLVLYPHSQNPRLWEEDPLAEQVIFDQQGKYSFDRNRFPPLVRAAGGALPMTVEYLSSGGTIFLSRRHQLDDSFIPAGTMSQGHVLGLLDGRMALLRCGSGLVKMKMDRIVSGLPAGFYDAALRALKHMEAVIWLRGEEGGEIRCGISDEQNQEFLVEVMDVISTGNGDTIRSGLICRALNSMAFYWLPDTHVGWARMTPEQLRRIFIHSDRSILKVKNINRERGTSYVSVIDVVDIKKEFSSFTIGKELFVQVIESIKSESDKVSRYLVKSFTSQVVLECETYGNHTLNVSLLAPVEVIRRVFGAPSSVTVTPIGKKQLLLDLPVWMVEDSSIENGVFREQFKNYLGWRAEKPLVSTVTVATLGDNGEQLNRLICQAFDGPGSGLDFQINVAREWIKENKFKKEIDVAYAIMAILLLLENSGRNPEELARHLSLPRDVVKRFSTDWRNEAYSMIQNLGRRALRSLHVEVLFEDWLHNSDNMKRQDGLWRRLQQLRSHLRVPLLMEDIPTIRQFCRAVEVRNIRDIFLNLQPISDGLSAATGTVSNISLLYSRAEVSRSLIEIYRSLPFNRSSCKVPLPKRHIERLEWILDRIGTQGLDITLLEPLPVIDK